jgi:hypothetical protein
MAFSVSPLSRRPGATHYADTNEIVLAQPNVEYSQCLSRHDVNRATHRGVHNVHMHQIRTTRYGPQNYACAHNTLSVAISMSRSVKNAPLCVVRTSQICPPIDLHRHCGTEWREVECVPLVTDFLGGVYICTFPFENTEFGNSGAPKFTL